MPGKPIPPSPPQASATKPPAGPIAASATSSRSPTLIPDAFSENGEKITAGLQSHLLASIQLMQRYLPGVAEAERSKWERQLSALQATLRMVHKASPGQTASAETTGEAIDPERVREFGDLVASSRSAAGLSRRDLSRLSGLSEKTIWNVEEAVTVPTHATVLRLVSVRELNLSSEQIPWQHSGLPDYGTAPNCWIAPGYEPLRLFADLLDVLNGPGGAVEQTFVYLDHQSAVNWYELCNQSFYTAKYRARLPLDSTARRIIELSRHSRLDVIALGSGDGKQECRLVQHLLDWTDEKRYTPDLRLYLLDVSQPLLSAAYQHASETIGNRRGVLVQAIQGNFHYWPRYTQLHYRGERGHRRRLVSLIGFTIGNLENEARFFQHTLVGLAPDDLLLLDVLNAAADPQNPDEVLRKDAAFSAGPSVEHQTWLTGPLMRYCQDLESVELKYALGDACTVPGSYAIDVIAHVQMRDHRRRRFALHRFKRYDPERLADMMRHLGWMLEEATPYGPDAASPVATLLLFRKQLTSRPG